MNDSTMNPPPSTLRVERPKEGNAYIVNDDEDGGVKYGYNEDISHPSRASLDSNHNQHTSRRRLNVTSDAYNTNEKYLQTNVMFRPSRVLVYAPPRQRQKWGDAQVLPRVNWGDLFFDLFYVAATYNVSNIFVNAPNARGFLYAAGTFFPVMAIWNQKTFFDSRFATEADVLHRLLDGFIMIVLGVAISHIRLVSAMSNASGTDSSMLVFAMMLAIDRLFAMSLFAEVYFRGVGQRVQLKRAAFRDASFSSIALIFYVAAVIVAALDFFGNPNETGYRWLAVEEGAGVADPPTDRRNDVPIYLCLIGNITYSICYFANIVFFFPADGRHKEMYVFCPKRGVAESTLPCLLPCFCC